jgi:ribosomal protein L11
MTRFRDRSSYPTNSCFDQKELGIEKGSGEPKQQSGDLKIDQSMKIARHEDDVMLAYSKKRQ